MPRITAEIENLNAMIRQMRLDNPALAEPWRAFLKDATDLVVREAKKRAEVGGEGRMAAGVQGRLEAKPVPTYGIVTDNAESNGVRYPFVLSAGHFKRRARVQDIGLTERRRNGVGTGRFFHRRRTVRTFSPDFNWAGGPKRGHKTRKWFPGALYEMRPKIEQLLVKAAREMERRFNR